MDPHPAPQQSQTPPDRRPVVMKFGGTSVGTPQRIRCVGALALQRGNPSGPTIMVLSAMAGTTNALADIADYLYRGNPSGAKEVIHTLEVKYDAVVTELFPDDQRSRADADRLVRGTFNFLRTFSPDGFDQAHEKEILAQGELVSTALMTLHLRSLGHDVELISALDYMRTGPDGEPIMPYVAERLTGAMARHPDAEVFITQGYICRNDHGDIDNLHRGGSDYSASIVAAALEAREVQIWTDIDGMHNNDPRYVDGTAPVHELNYEEAAELAYFGAKILHPTCVLPAKLHNIPVRLLNTLQPDARGTLISSARPGRGTIKAVAAKDGITAIKVKSGRMLLAHGFLQKVFETFDQFRTAVDMVVTSEVGVSLTIDNEQYLRPITDRLRQFGTVTIDRGMTIICVVGDLEWHNRGFEAHVLNALADIPVRMISYGGSNYNISVLVCSKDKVEALRRLSSHLFDSTPPTPL